MKAKAPWWFWVLMLLTMGGSFGAGRVTAGTPPPEPPTEENCRAVIKIDPCVDPCADPCWNYDHRLDAIQVKLNEIMLKKCPDPCPKIEIGPTELAPAHGWAEPAEPKKIDWNVHAGMGGRVMTAGVTIKPLKHWSFRIDGVYVKNKTPRIDQMSCEGCEVQLMVDYPNTREIVLVAEWWGR